MNRLAKTEFLLITLIILASTLATYGANENSESIPVVAMEITRGSISNQILTTGEVIPRYGVDIHPDVSGQIQEFRVAEGSMVKAGQTMIQIDNQVQQSQVEQAQAAVVVAKAAIEMQKVLVKSSKSMLSSAKAQADSVKAQLNNLVTTKQRLTQLFKEGAISRQQLDDTIASHDATAAQMKAASEGIQQAMDSIQTQQMTLKMKEAQLTQAQANLNSAQVMLDKTTIKAAFDGIVTARYADPGAMANPAKPLLRLEQMNPVKIVGSVIEKDLERIVPQKTKAIVRVDSISQAFSGQVEKIYPTINSTTRTGKLEIIIENSEYKLRSGMFAQIQLLLETKENIVVVPRDVLLKHNGKSFAYLIRNNIAIKQEVQTGIVQDTNVEIISGLNPGEQIISEGLEFIKEGSKVIPVMAGDNPQ